MAMPKVVKGQRKRAYRPKTRSGCLTCRSRTCDGYLHPRRLEQLDPNAASVATLTDPIATGSCQRSRRSFTFFAQRTCRQLAGFFGSYFGESLVFQAAHHELAVYHAITAIGALGETLELEPSIREMNKAFLIKQYTLAIRELLVSGNRNDAQYINVCLISCLLFTCFENMQGNHKVAGFHIRSGLKLLSETISGQQNTLSQNQRLKRQSNITLYVPFDILFQTFASIDPRSTTTRAYDELKRCEALIPPFY
ncbi:hypothetical protein BX600DRAFT_438002 [Xylariales sp. PMI_506]|nr:hypothetical protein BX600DRAFT_438002 [Xylariales sp. PMI_506]